MERIFIKKCFLFTVGNNFAYSGPELGGKSFSDDEEIEMVVRK
jgi:hypothetical protein